MIPQYIHNPHLEGGELLWRAGDTGVLLFHGFTASVAEVRPLAEVLHRNGYTVVAPLLPGHMQTPDDLNRVSWRDWTAAVEQSYSDLAQLCTRVVVGGESMGGLLALYLGSEHPEIAALLLYAPALRLALNWVERVALRIAVPFIPAVPKADFGNDPLWQGYPVWPTHGVGQLRQLQSVVGARLPRVTQPLLIAQGRHDASVHPASPGMITARVASKIKKMHWLEDSTHCVLLDCEREKVGALTLEFLARILGD